jgi:hypothetical protein
MGKAIRVPDPVYSKVTTEAERQDISRGAVVREWMQKAEKFEQMEGRHR